MPKVLRRPDTGGSVKHRLATIRLQKVIDWPVIGPREPPDGRDGRLGPRHSLLSVLSARLWLQPAEKTAQEPRRGPPWAPAQRAFGATPVVLVRQPFVTAPAQHGAAGPNLHGTPIRRCRHHDLSATGDSAIRCNGHMDLTTIRSGIGSGGAPGQPAEPARTLHVAQSEHIGRMDPGRFSRAR